LIEPRIAREAMVERKRNFIGRVWARQGVFVGED
jgi:hypothetical protein